MAWRWTEAASAAPSTELLREEGAELFSSPATPMPTAACSCAWAAFRRFCVADTSLSECVRPRSRWEGPWCCWRKGGFAEDDDEEDEEGEHEEAADNGNGEMSGLLPHPLRKPPALSGGEVRDWRRAWSTSGARFEPGACGACGAASSGGGGGGIKCAPLSFPLPPCEEG